MRILIQQENFAGKVLDQISIQVDQELITVRELIQKRVEKEVEAFGERQLQHRKQFFQSVEQQLNPKKKNQPHPLADTEKEVYKAWEAFQNNQFFLFVGDEQMESLDQEILVREDTRLRFMQLTPLVGG